MNNNTENIINDLNSMVEWLTTHSKNTNSAVLVCHKAINQLKLQQEAIEELTDYIIDIENYHENRLDKLQEKVALSITALDQFFTEE